MAIVLKQRPEISFGGTELVAIDFTPLLDADETLVNPPTVVEVGKVTSYVNGQPVYESTSHLTISNKAINTAAKVILKETVAIGKAAQFLVSGQQDDLVYGIRVTVTTTSSPARVLVRDALLTVK